MTPRLLLVLLFVITANAQTGPCATVTGPQLPNLISFAQVSKQSAFVSMETFTDTDCSVVEGGVTSGTHRLLRFDSQIGNVGSVDLVLGYPPDCGNLYVFDPCHGHYHVNFATVYRLWTTAGYDQWVTQRDMTRPMSDPYNASLLDAAESTGQLIRSHKQGFCFIDSVRLGGTPAFTKNEFGVRVSTSHFQHCYNNQGLTAGYGDLYGALLDGQFFVVDTVAPGWYVIEVQANPEQILPESSFTDNSSGARVRL